MGSTHEVTNQPPPLLDYNALAIDPATGMTLQRIAGSDLGLSELGRLAGAAATQRWAEEANTYPPVLRAFDRFGRRTDEVDFHPSWHKLLGVAVGWGLHGSPWGPDPAGGEHAHLRRAAGFYLWSQAEAGHGCPVSMTYAALPALRLSPGLAERFEPGLTSRAYQRGLADPATKTGLLAGMGMTEKQGGSDVRTNTTLAVPDGDGLRLTGHKWFCSAPMSDLFLVLAQVAGAGLTCCCVPRVLPGGERNPFALQRLKDKLGNRSNASAEVEFDGTYAEVVGEVGRGIPAIMEMVALTRLDCVLGSAAGQRAALVQAIHHTRHRRAFEALLADQPLMQQVLADLALESEAATALGLRLAAAVDAGERALLRATLPAAKYWVCKRSATMIGEALECLGGNGYVEASGMPRLFRESPLNSIWEGSGNVIALDVQRALSRDRLAEEALIMELRGALGQDRHYDVAVREVQTMISVPAEPRTARRLAERLALLLQAGLLIRTGPGMVAEAFCASRLGDVWGHTFGTMPAGIDTERIVDRAFPA